MAVSMPSGLGASFGFTTESSVGTFTTTSMRWPRFDKEGFYNNKTTIQGVGLHQGLYQESRRRALVQRDANGTVTMDLANTQMGALCKHMLGINTTGTNGTAVQQSASSAYRQNHAPGDTLGLGLSVQVGRPQANGTIQQFNYAGCKVMDWTVSVSRSEFAKLELNFDSWSEDTSTAYAAPSLASNNVFDFSQGSLLLGGTASTTTGVTSISAGAAPSATIQSVSIKGTNPMKQDRYTLGSTTKREQLVNNVRTVEVEVQAEFANLTDFYTSLFQSDTATAVEFKLTGGLIASGAGNSYYFDVILPAVVWDEYPLMVDGPDVLNVTIKGSALDDGTNNPVQLQVMSTDTSI